MAKKSQRRSAPGKRRPMSTRPPVTRAAVATQVTEAAPRAVSPSQVAPQKVDFATEYHYVLGDLKRIAVLAAAMFATLIVLALVIR